MTAIIGIGVGAGVVSALLTLVIATGSPIALLLSFLAPLPIAIAALGWNHKAGLIGAAVGALILGLLVNPRMAAAFLLSTALPAWWFSFLSLLARPSAAPGGPAEWYPTGRVLAWIAGVIAALGLVGAWMIAGDYDAFVKSCERVIEIAERLSPTLFDGVAPEARPQLRAAMAALVAAIGFPAYAVISVWVAAALLVIAGRIVLASGRLPRPWPYLPALTLPRALLGAIAATFAGSFLGGFIGLCFRTIFAALLAAYALQGLALVHAITSGKAGRSAMLTAVYFVSALFGGWPLIAAAIGGVADALFNIRARRGLADPAGA
ncbi:DUF2232 domain-containing protein [Terrarubrum flagellatum]|uniref:DUF2232 domain-containing protein n=1 Tax=Terrirubrum flagellatum TaxID=2895980 RepID=UPI003144DADC